jgi:D-alanyl-D-alanine carboxypeptidase
MHTLLYPVQISSRLPRLLLGALILSAILAFNGCGSMAPDVEPEAAPAAKADPARAAQLQALLDSLINQDGEYPIHNAALLVETPAFRWQGAAGFADGEQEPMTPRHKFKIASIGKTFTATVIFQLVEEGRLRLDNTLPTFFEGSFVRLDSLQLHDGQSWGRTITVEQLLSHTSGIRDYMEDPRFIPFVLEYPDTQWSAEMILGKYYEYNMHHKTPFAPGGGFDYSDVNYVLLAMIIEQVTGSTLAEQFRARIFEPLGMDNSYLEFYEQPRGDLPLSHAFFSTVDIALYVNTSFDWGGGGIVSTPDELNTYFKALMTGKLFKQTATLQMMLAQADKGLGGMDYDYGYGIQKRIIHGLTFYGHGGAYDCDIFYCPEQQISVVTVMNQMETLGKRDPFLYGAIEIAMQ